MKNSFELVLYRARALWPGIGPAISDAGLLVREGRIAAMAPWQELSTKHTSSVCDLGEMLVFPGFVNAHCHLEYTQMAGLLNTDKSFAGWLGQITTLNNQWSDNNCEQSQSKGAQMLIRRGCTTVVNVERTRGLSSRLMLNGLRVIPFPEIIAHQPCDVFQPPKNSAILFETLERLDLPVGLSPHAPYTTTPKVLRGANAWVNHHGRMLTIHVAESEDEWEMFMNSSGPLYEKMQTLGRPMKDCGGVTPVACLRRCNLLGKNLLAIHANCITDEDIRALAESGASIAHCPRSHAWFGHRKFRLVDLKRNGVNICIGTDSLASTREAVSLLDMFAEMNLLAKSEPGLRPDDILRMATVNGARALAMEGQIGTLTPGAFADMAIIPSKGNYRNAAEAILNHDEDVAGIMVNGQWWKPAGGEKGEPIEPKTSA